MSKEIALKKLKEKMTNEMMASRQEREKKAYYNKEPKYMRHVKEVAKFIKRMKQPDKWFKERKIKDKRCGICGTYDWVYPLPVETCEKCSNKLYPAKIRKAKIRSDLLGIHFCMECGKYMTNFYEISLYACKRCVGEVAKEVKLNKLKEQKRKKKIKHKINNLW